MSIHNQPQKKHETYNQARARAVTYHRSQSRPSDAALEPFCCCCCCCGSKTSRKYRERRRALSHFALSHSRLLSPSRQHHRTPPQKNSAFMLISSRGRPSEGGVLSRGRPSPKAGVSAMAKERGGRKMITSLSPRAKRPFYIAWPAPHRCLNRPRLRFDWRPEKKGDQSGTRRAASHTASKSVAYRVLPWGELT